MSRLRPISMLVVFTVAAMAQLPPAAHAADLDRPYERHRHLPRGHLPARPPSYGEEEVVVHDRPLIAEVPVPVHVGGAFIYVPGLNGPSGPPVYPLLPFAFGYGY